MNPQMCFEQWVNSFEKRVSTQVTVHVSNNTESRKGQPYRLLGIVINGSSFRVGLKNYKKLDRFSLNFSDLKNGPSVAQQIIYSFYFIKI